MRTKAIRFTYHWTLSGKDLNAILRLLKRYYSMRVGHINLDGDGTYIVDAYAVTNVSPVSGFSIINVKPHTIERGNYDEHLHCRHAL